MPSVRLSAARTPARLSLLVLFVGAAFFVTLVRVEPPASSACPIVISKPLRTLYKESDLVAVVRVGDSVAVETQKYARLVKTTLLLSTLLKGESEEKTVDFYHYVWGEEEAGGQNVYLKGETLLVFLKPREKGDGYVVADGERGVKQLPDDALKVYVRRIEELAAILRDEKPDPAATTEWLVRCAEEPATRWEGAYELGSNVALPEDPQDETEAKESGDTVDADKANTEAVNDEKETENGGNMVVVQTAGAEQSGVTEAGEKVEVVLSTSVQPDEAINFAALLTPTQKERLTTALLNAEELSEGEYMLMRLVGSWKEARLLPFLLKHLVHIADKPTYDAEDMMRIIANMHGDQTLIKFVANYSKTASYEDLYDQTDEEEDNAATAEERAASKKEAEERKAAAAEALFQRSGKLRHFIVLADQAQKP